MPVIMQIARPFTFNPGHRPKLRYGIGVYLVPDEYAANHHFLHHVQQHVVARGEALVQHRVPQQTWHPGSVWYRSLSIVTNIEPQQVLIWRWPLRGDFYAFPWHSGVVEPAPGVMLVVAARHVGEDGKETWRRELRESEPMSIPPHYYFGHGTPSTVTDNPFAAFGAGMQSIGDTIVFGEQPGVPFVLDRWGPAFPEEPPLVKERRLRQEAAVARAQTGRWPLRGDVGPTIQDLTRQALAGVPGAAKRPTPTAYFVPGFELDDSVGLVDA
jgi:hypothetical protein